MVNNYCNGKWVKLITTDNKSVIYQHIAKKSWAKNLVVLSFLVQVHPETYPAPKKKKLVISEKGKEKQKERNYEKKKKNPRIKQINKPPADKKQQLPAMAL